MIDNPDTGQKPPSVLQEAGDAGVVDDRRALLEGSLGEIDQQARIIELPIVIQYAAA